MISNTNEFGPCHNGKIRPSAYALIGAMTLNQLKLPGLLSSKYANPTICYVSYADMI